MKRQGELQGETQAIEQMHLSFHHSRQARVASCLPRAHPYHIQSTALAVGESIGLSMKRGAFDA